MFGGNCTMCGVFMPHQPPHAIATRNMGVDTWCHPACYDVILEDENGGYLERPLAEEAAKGAAEEEDIPYVRHLPFYDSLASSSGSAESTDDNDSSKERVVRKVCFYSYGEKRTLTYKVELPGEGDLVNNFIANMQEKKSDDFYEGFLTKQPTGKRSRKQLAPRKRHRGEDA